MRTLLARMRQDSGQAMLFMVFALMSLVAMTSLVIDGGSWMRMQRQVQTAADAAALAGAQDLPIDATASSTAVSYAQQNFNGIAAPTVTFPSSSPCAPYSCIDVVAAKPVSGIFLPALSATARAHARAMVSVPLSMKNVAPIAVRDTAACVISNPNCFGQTVTVNFNESQVNTSTIGLINLACNSDAMYTCDGGQLGGSDLKDEIKCTPCYPNSLPADKWYGVKTGDTVGPVRQGLADAAAARTVLLFPVFDQIAPDVNHPAFHVIGWAAFVIDVGGVTWTSQNRQLVGHFTTFIATDVASGGAIGGATDFGVHTVALTE